MSLQVFTHISDISPEQWPDNGNPLCSYNFYKNLEQSLVVTAEKGWQPVYFCYFSDNGSWILPSFIKSHSYGEYVFDWAWADAHERSGLRYYPKLLSATPVTPCIAPKWIVDKGFESKQSLLTDLLASIREWLGEQGLSSWHINFADEPQSTFLSEQPFMERHDIQFHWANDNYQSFADFLTKLKAKKRKNIRQERRKVQQAGWSFKFKKAKDISKEEWRLVYQFYTNNFDKRGSWAQLTPEFFENLTALLPNNAMINFAYQQEKPLAMALFFLSETHLYGRYWGAEHNLDPTVMKGVHFETCYYQAIEWAIENNLKTFEPGAQGEHKLARGFDPVLTRSFHQVVHPQFSEAIKNVIQQENAHKQQALEYYQQHSAYNR